MEKPLSPAEKLTRSFSIYLDWVSRHPLRVLLATALITLAIGSGLSRLKIYVDLDANMPAGHPYVDADKEIRALFGGRNFVGIAFQPRRGSVWTPRMLGLLVDLTRDGSALPQVIEGNVFSLAAPKAKDIQGGAEGFEVKQILENRPETEADISRVREAYEKNFRYLGPLIGRDGDAAIVFLDFAETATDEEIYHTTTALVRRYEKLYPDVEFFQSGSPHFMHFFTQNARRTGRNFLIALVVIMATLYAAFRSLQGMLLPIATGLLSTIWGLGLMGHAGTHMDGWNSMTPILILAVAAGHSVQILKRYYEEYARLASVAEARERSRLAVVEATSRIGLVMVVAGTVAAGSFASLVVFGIPSIRAFGLFTALGILSAIVLEMSFVPACRTLMVPPRTPRHSRGGPSDRVLRWLGASLAAPPLRRAVYVAGGLALIVSAVFTGRIETNNTVRDYLTPDNEARIGSEMIRERFGGMIPFLLLLEGDREDTFQKPEVLTWMAGLTDEILKVPAVAYASSLADVVRRLNLAMNADDPSFDRIPDNARLVAQYLFLYGLSSDPEDFSRFVTTDGTRGVVRVFLRTDESRDLIEAVEAVESYARAHPLPQDVTTRIGGAGPISLAMNQTLTEEKIHNIVQILVMVYLISSLILGSPVAGLFVLIPLVLAVAVNFAVLGALRIWLNMGTATVAAMGVGIGADYAIYIIYRFREELARFDTEREAAAATLATSGKAVLFVAAAISAGYGSLFFSDFYVNRILAKLVPLTMIVSCTAALTLMPAALLHLRPKFLFSGSARAARREAMRKVG